MSQVRERPFALFALVVLLATNLSSAAAEPRIASIRPADGSRTFPYFEAVLLNGDSAKVASATLKLDGVLVNPFFVPSDTGARIFHYVVGSLEPGSIHTFTLAYTDTAN